MKLLRLVALSAILFLSACNNSKLLTEDSPSGTGNGTGLSLSSTNAQTAAVVAFSAALNSAGFADLGGAVGASTNAPGTFLKPQSRQQTPGYLITVINQVPYGPDDLPCAVSGMLTLSGDIADPLTLTVGDFFLINATACNDGLGETLDGTLSMTVTRFTGDLVQQAYVLGMRADLDALQVTTQADVIASTGDATITLDTMTPLFVSAAVNGSEMTTSSNNDTEILTNFATDQTVDASQQTLPYTLQSSGTVDNSLLSGIISYTTPVLFQGSGAEFPSVGELLVSGNNSNVRLIALDNINVLIEIDADGNGTVDETINTTWLALTS